jgi:glycosyltransferase involved in cell wall biosynthesis
VSQNARFASVDTTNPYANPDNPGYFNVKIVLYNYVQPYETNTPGGGVSVYLKNLVTGLKARGHHIYTLSSGDRYGLFRRRPFVRFRRPDNEIIIFNSPNIAPASFSFYHPEMYSSDNRLDFVPSLLRDKLGHVDIFHFHNIEGLTKGFFFALRQAFPDSGILYSAHNYSTVCPQVHLWRNDTESCTDFQDGRACTMCIGNKDRRWWKMLINRLKTPVKGIRDQTNIITRTSYLTEKVLTKLASRLFYKENNPAGTEHKNSRWLHKFHDFSSFRADNIQLMNQVFDKVIAVSQRTKDILVSLGAESSKIDVLYIGTRYFENLRTSVKKIPSPGNLHIGYLGYMRKEKGFYFFLDCLEALPREVLARVDITIAAKFKDSEAVSRIKQLAPFAQSMNAFDGYTHKNLMKILEPINLGIVPPLWEDNLPQVAIELVTNGIPILTSDKGGAKEIADSAEFVFSTDSVDDLVGKITALAQGRKNMESFWERNLRLRSIDDHATDIVTAYQSICCDTRN